jgi:phage terminase large subunit-like protein
VSLAPTYSTLPEYAYTYGPEVASLCDKVGFTPDANQAAILDATFAVGRDGKPAAFEVVVIAPRQNIKTGVEKMAALGWLYLLERRLVMWSAHEFDTAAESFRDLTELVEGSDFLSRQLKKIYRGDGRECIETVSGRLRFKARTKAAGRGLSGDDSIIDEAFALKAVHTGALLPTMLARPLAQVMYGSSSGMFDSTILRGLRDRGRRGDERLAYFEWSDPNEHKGCADEDCDHHVLRVGCALDDRERWWATNPTLGDRIDEESIASLRRTLPPEEFARECLGWWDEPSVAESPLTVEAWQARADPDAAPVGDLVFGVDVGPGMGAAAIVAVGSNRVVEVIDRRVGAGWVASRLAQLVADHEPVAVVYDPAGPIRGLLPDLVKAGLDLVPIEARESISACGALIQAVNENHLTHRGEPEFDAAVAGARLRAVGDGNKWSRKDSSVDITPLVALTVAWWHAMNEEPDYDIASSFG